MYSNDVSLPPFQLTQSAVTGQEGHPRHENTGGCIQIDGGEHSPPDPNAQTNDTRDSTHSKALQMHKALPKMTESASPAATNVVARPDPAALGKP